MVSASDILKARILIVDDQAVTVRLLEGILQEAGYTAVASTTNPHEVCDLHRSNRYDLIMLDLQMPGMNGFQVMNDLKAVETGGYLPVLALTSQPSFMVHALKGGAKDFVAKPFAPEEVLTRVHNMLEVRLLHAAARNDVRELAALALHDPLTGLANRRLLSDRISMALANARRSRSAMAVVYLDLDGFKQINDTLGHSSGDILLQMVARRLVGTVREEDAVARLGGDEFAIALWHVGRADTLAAVASKMVKAVSQPYVIDGQSVIVTTSAGVAIFPDHGTDADALLKSADAALYEAKHAGKNVFRIAERKAVEA